MILFFFIVMEELEYFPKDFFTEKKSEPIILDLLESNIGLLFNRLTELCGNRTIHHTISFIKVDMAGIAHYYSTFEDESNDYDYLPYGKCVYSGKYCQDVIEELILVTDIEKMKEWFPDTVAGLLFIRAKSATK